MAEFDTRLAADVERFRKRVYEDDTEVLDPAFVVHHEFVSGNHGRKLDFDKIEQGTDFYIDWVSVYARAMRALYEGKYPNALLGIANGANRLSRSIAPLLGAQVLGLTTEKLNAKTVRVDEKSLSIIAEQGVKSVVTIEDVGTTGGTTLTAVEHLREVGIEDVESVNFWQRNASLPKLESAGVVHHAIILDPLPMYSPEDCATPPGGYCAKGVPLVAHN